MRVCPRCASETEEAVCPADGTATVAVQADQRTYPIGTLVGGRYRVDDVIGIGGFGAVYRCTNLAMEQTVALKVLRTEHLSSVEHVKRFSREAQAVSRLKHPNTIHTFDFGTHTDGALYLAMEYLEGETLADRIDQNRCLYWETAVHIAVQACHSLTEAHALGLVHRDLKPENFMLMPVAGDPNFVKVLDFGIAKLQKTPTEARQSNLTESGMIMGTPTYMSPEQAKGEAIDARSDIYAIGVMLYEMLTGRPPFEDETAMKILVAHINAPPKPFFRAGGPDDVPVEVERVVMQCLEKDPTRRPQTTVQLVDRLMSAARKAREPAESRSRPADLGLPGPGDDLAEGATLQLPDPGLGALGNGRSSRPNWPVAADAALAGELPAPRMAVAPLPDRTGLWVAVGALLAVALGVGIALTVGAPPQRQPAAPAASPATPPATSVPEPAPQPVVRGAAPMAAKADQAQPATPVAVAAEAAPKPPDPLPTVAADNGAPAGDGGAKAASKTMRPAIGAPRPGKGATVGAPAGPAPPQPDKAAAEKAAVEKAAAEKTAAEKAAAEKAAAEKAAADKAAAERADKERAGKAQPKAARDDFRLDDESK
ncbi:MAG: serine/threonine protein kinase [Deltaproteobacteria bacterium]|nr:serine/threonine protein kinase [Deltaproteobacteria bacterium]